MNTNYIDLENVVVGDRTGLKGKKKVVADLIHLAESRAGDYMRLLQPKNQINRLSIYHYLLAPIEGSTGPINSLDYIHPVVAPGVDYSTAVVAKCLMPNGRIEATFEPMNTADEPAARQTTRMVMEAMNTDNEMYAVIKEWVQEAMVSKNSVMHVMAHKQPVVFYRTIVDNVRNIQQFLIYAASKGLEAKIVSKKAITVDPTSAIEQTLNWATNQQVHEMQEDELGIGEGNPMETLMGELQEEIELSTIYEIKFKLTGHNTTVRYVPIPQHYFICNPTIQHIQRQDFVGYFTPMTVHQVKEEYPDIDMDMFMEYGTNGPMAANQAGAIENSLAWHIRDSTPVTGNTILGSAGVDPAMNQFMVLKGWIRADVDNDGNEEIIEMVWSGQYIISAREVEYIPLANMCPRPIPHNFFGFSQAERLIASQEYATSIQRAEQAMAMYSSTPRVGVNPETVDFEEIQNGISAVFYVDKDFDPTKDIFPFPQPQGNISYVQVAMERLQQDSMAMIGMTTPGDVLNPEVMREGNSAAKLQLALGPNQIIQDDIVKQCAIGLKELVYLTYRTLVDNGDDYGVRRLAARVSGEGYPFIDYDSTQQFDPPNRNDIRVDLAIGLMSDENRINRAQLINAEIKSFLEEISALTQQGITNPVIISQLRKSHEDALYAMGVKAPDDYLPTMETLAAANQEKQQQGPDPEMQKLMAETKLTDAKTQQIMHGIQIDQREADGQTFNQQMDASTLVKDTQPQYIHHGG